MTTTTYEIDRRSLPVVERLVEKLGPRARRCGVEAPTLTLGASRFTPRFLRGDEPNRPTGIREWLTVTLTATQPALAGWHFVAKVEHTPDGNVVSKAPGQEDAAVPIALREQEPICDHCRTRRRRDQTFFVRHEDGREATVGSTCVKDFCHLNTDPHALLAYLDALAVLDTAFGGGGEDEDDEDNGPRGRSLIDTRYFLTNVAACIGAHGWTSRGRARDEGREGTDTATQALNNMHDLRNRLTRATPLSEADVALAEAAYTWVSEVLAEQPVADRSDYIHNLVVAMRPGIESKHAGIVASAISAYLREQERAVQSRLEAERQAALPPSCYWLTPGKRGDIVAMVEAVHHFENDFGVTTMILFRADSGEVLKWNASGNRPVAAGERYTVRGTVKCHSEYRGTKQTVISRAALSGAS